MSVCNVCVGTGEPISGRPCICGGVGTEQAELQGFRELAYDLEKELSHEREKVAKLEALVRAQNYALKEISVAISISSFRSHPLLYILKIADNALALTPSNLPRYIPEKQVKKLVDVLGKAKHGIFKLHQLYSEKLGVPSDAAYRCAVSKIQFIDEALSEFTKETK